VNLAAHTQDDGFHEIQLNGKQLVFLFMAATVVSVGIFLCGVLVGRGVRVERGATGDPVAFGGATEPTPQPPAPATATMPPPPAGSDPTAAAAPPAVDDLTYFNRLENSKPPAEQLKAAKSEEPAAGAAAPAPKPVPVAKAPALAKAQASTDAPASANATPKLAERTSDAAPAGEPKGAGYAVQIAALNVRGEADAIAKRLSSKGYAAYVLQPANGTPQIYRVRIGKFGSRREAETMAAKLQKEEQFKPWITR
jgi:septal ring-binding cell division protein DamX